MPCACHTQCTCHTRCAHLPALVELGARAGGRPPAPPAAPQSWPRCPWPPPPSGSRAGPPATSCTARAACAWAVGGDGAACAGGLCLRVASRAFFSPCGQLLLMALDRQGQLATACDSPRDCSRTVGARPETADSCPCGSRRACWASGITCSMAWILPKPPPPLKRPIGLGPHLHLTTASALRCCISPPPGTQLLTALQQQHSSNYTPPGRGTQ